MRDDGVYLDGREIKNRPQFFLGAAASPYAAVPRYEAIREEKKVNAGAQFIQTQPVFDTLGGNRPSSRQGSRNPSANS